MSKRNCLAVVAGVVTVGLLAAGGLWAQAGPGGGPFERRPLLEFVFENLGRLAQLRRRLHLSPEQKTKLTELLKSRKPDIVQAVGQIRTGRKKILAAVRAEPVNESAIRAAVAAVTQPLADAAVLRSKLRREALALLTPEQRGRVDKFIMEAQDSADEAFDEFAGK